MTILMTIGGIIVNIDMIVLEIFLLINILKEVPLIIKIVVWTLISGLNLFFAGLCLGVGFVEGLLLLFFINAIIISILFDCSCFLE